MNERDLLKAILFLKPTAQFSFTETDYSTIKWDRLEGDAPTWAEIEVAHEAVKHAEIQQERERQTKRIAAEAKLAALGLTADDLKALGL